jgi:REP-associated tyrosine transposase
MPEYRRRLPHFHPIERYLFLTWRLWGSLPNKPDFTVYPTPGHVFVAHDRMLDKHRSGPRWLQEHAIADLAARAILVGDCERHFYQLYAWVLMPNHVHLLILPQVPTSEITRWLKGSTARGANRILGRTGLPFWQDESYDHYLRNPDQMNRTMAYIEQNPVSAGLVDSVEHWRWSSAGWQAAPPAPPKPNQYLSPT